MESMMRKIDVLVIGAGPAGTVCGSLLRQAGVECVLVDQASFPRDKVCGGGLTVKAWRLLDQLLPGIEYDYSPVKHLRLRYEQDPACEFDAEYELRMTNRRDFDYSLVRYYQQGGGELLRGSFASYEKQADGRILVTLKDGRQFDCRYLVAADGAYSLVRRQMFGEYQHNAFFIEQYTEKTGQHEIYVQFARQYGIGCLYKFPGADRDTWGFRAPGDTSRERFQEELQRYGVPSGRIVGAYIPMRVVESHDDHIIFIGDAGGFPNRITGEGLYDAFKTALHARTAIVEGRPFSEVNRQVFLKMRAQDKLYRFCENRFFLGLFRRILRHPRLFKWMFDTKMKRETYFGS